MYSREIDDEVLTLSASGWLYDYTFVLFDYETSSLWYPVPGETGLTCVGGHYAGRKLEKVESFTGPWPIWKKNNPRSKYMDVEKVAGPRP